MPEETPEVISETPAPSAQTALEGGAYEIIRARLDKHGAELRERLGKLNTDRQAVFGAIEPQLIATERVTTKNNCTARDLVSIGDGRFLFGYNVQLGLKSTTDVADVFSVYSYSPEDHTFHELSLSDIEASGGSDFVTDFQYLYKFYKETLFVKFMVIGPNLYMGFRIGKGVDDLKAFKFRINGDGTLTYIGNRYDHEYLFPPQQEFEWVRAHRDMHRDGEHPHISVMDRLFVETIGGDLTVKIEDNTASGHGIYTEPVENADQTLDDAEIFYAIVGSLIVLKIKPYQEKDFRILVFNEKTGQVRRIDSIEHSCVLLPDDHGIIFSNGYHLQTGETKIFESDLTNMFFDRRIASSNGEDFLYIFYNRLSGDYILMPYNLIEQKVDTPIICNGYSLFENGELIYFRSDAQAQKHHALQVWKTPYTGDDYIADAETDSYLYKLGNADVVRCMAECYEVLGLLTKDDSYADLYVDLTKKTGDIGDSYFWVNRDEAYNLKEALDAINGAAQSAIAEFDKVQRLRNSTKDETSRVRDKARKLISSVEHTRPDDIMGFVHHLAELRTVRGEIISLRDLRYVDSGLVDKLESEVEEATRGVSGHCVEFLLLPEALDPYRAQVDEQKGLIAGLGKVSDADQVAEALDKAGEELEMLIDIVGNLKIDDSTKTTQIIDDVSTIYSTLNQVKVELKNKRKELARGEGVAQFGAQIKLLNQAVINYLDLCQTPEKTEEYLTKVMVQIEELEGKFSEFDEYVEQLSEKREEVYDAFESRKQSLIEQRNKRAGTLVRSGERILKGIRNRVSSFETVNEINGYLASDLMIDKVRDVIAQLTTLGDSVKADDLQTQLKTIREDSVRQLKDRNELYVDGKDIIQFGKHKFSVNTQELDLSIVPRDDEMFFHLGGTDFFEEIEDEAFLETRPVWEQQLLSENEHVYRAEYLAWLYLAEYNTVPTLAEIQQFMGPRYSEGYTKGVHDQDAVRILSALIPIHQGIGLLRFTPAARALAILFWTHQGEWNETLRKKVQSFGLMAKTFENEKAQREYIREIEGLISKFVESTPFEVEEGAAEYLFYELQDDTNFTVSPESAEIATHFTQSLTSKRVDKAFAAACESVADDVAARYQIILDWVAGSAESDSSYLPEAAAHLLRGGLQRSEVSDVSTATVVEGMLGSHPSINEDKSYSLDYLAFSQKLMRFEREVVPRFESYQHLKSELVDAKRNMMRLDEFKPRVMSSFVRNRLLDQVYLPIVGDNLAKQMGTAGGDTRTDRMGLLLLVSPPGYGKTTLMEYIANRIGVTFMKINGPAIGHDVTSLDPADAPNASAREEIKKLNLALEMGDNIMLYLDDIQHCNPEFLQKFISLCDGQRKIEGVYDGQAKTYDLRGKKVAVVMAGNPYTESGGKFQIPDMLANRADTYNLGDILGGHEAAFKDSYIENCLTSNPVLSKLASRSQKDVYAIMELAESDSQEGIDFEGNYSVEEIEELVSVMKKLMRVRDTILRVNLEYIRSAAMEDAYRTEPAFKLQGSYRNMNRIAEKIIGLMTDEEVESLIIDHYANESQTLTDGAEANLLKFHELEKILTPDETARWDEIKKTFGRNQLTGGAGEDDPVTRMLGGMKAFTKGLDDIKETIALGSSTYAKPQTLGDQTVDQLEKIISGLRAVPVEVEIKVVPVHEGGNPAPKKKGAAKKKATKKDPELPVDIESNIDQKS